jgi:hypothetical protein
MGKPFRSVNLLLVLVTNFQNFDFLSIYVCPLFKVYLG